MSERFEEAVSRFDAANHEDPNTEVVDGQARPAAWLYAQRLSGWVLRLDPAASVVLRLAARCQHIRRWEIPRERYPMDRQGYLQWRSELARFHADIAARILADAGYDSKVIDRVRDLLLKKNLKTDPEMQLLEDAICLVFLESYFSGFSQKHDPEKVINILRRTWRKMSPRGREVALTLDIPSHAQTLIEQAVADA